jgi:hypothetical protein
MGFDTFPNGCITTIFEKSIIKNDFFYQLYGKILKTDIEQL